VAEQVVVSAIDPPLCRLCSKPHWQRAGCDFGKKSTPKPKPITLLEPAKRLKKKARKKAKRK